MSHLIQNITAYFAESPTKALILGFSGYVSFALWGVVKTILRPYISPLRTIKGPPGATLLRGHFPHIRAAEDTAAWHHEQFKEYGHVWVHKASFNVSVVKHGIYNTNTLRYSKTG